jgi:hypothetical protein
MLAPLISDSGWIVSRVCRFFKPNSISHGRPGSTVKLYPTDRVTDGLGVEGNMRLYFEGFLCGVSVHIGWEDMRRKVWEQ